MLSIESDKSLAHFRAGVVTLQSASVSSVEATRARSEWPLLSRQGQHALRHTGGRPRPSPPARVRASLWRKNRRQPFLGAQRAPEAWHQQDVEFQRSAFLVCFPSGQNKDTVTKICDESFPDFDDAFRDHVQKTAVITRTFPNRSSLPAVHRHALWYGFPVFYQQPTGSAKVCRRV